MDKSQLISLINKIVEEKVLETASIMSEEIMSVVNEQMENLLKTSNLLRENNSKVLPKENSREMIRESIRNSVGFDTIPSHNFTSKDVAPQYAERIPSLVNLGRIPTLESTGGGVGVTKDGKIQVHTETILDSVNNPNLDQSLKDAFTKDYSAMLKRKK